ncbi:hypothetical protein FNF27_01222 [Cafeteria roenbergensis]|uniref:Ubiquitin-like domain-containing protein n=1 Tax=Cafeteria roenbergensis TaxID=33653 RepID=A0A5A8EJK9_CAFRO|nr:hypothetical protein FNF27_01222 [Cafeteria roenbergensis]
MAQATGRMLHVIDVYQTDKSIVVAVEESDTLADLKKRITSRHVDSPAPSAQRLVAGGKELSDLGVSVRVALGSTDAVGPPVPSSPLVAATIGGVAPQPASSGAPLAAAGSQDAHQSQAFQHFAAAARSVQQQWAMHGPPSSAGFHPFSVPMAPGSPIMPPHSSPGMPSPEAMHAHFRAMALGAMASSGGSPAHSLGHAMSAGHQLSPHFPAPGSPHHMGMSPGPLPGLFPYSGPGGLPSPFLGAQGSPHMAPPHGLLPPGMALPPVPYTAAPGTPPIHTAHGMRHAMSASPHSHPFVNPGSNDASPPHALPQPAVAVAPPSVYAMHGSAASHGATAPPANPPLSVLAAAVAAPPPAPTPGPAGPAASPGAPAGAESATAAPAPVDAPPGAQLAGRDGLRNRASRGEAPRSRAASASGSDSGATSHSDDEGGRDDDDHDEDDEAGASDRTRQHGEEDDTGVRAGPAVGGPAVPAEGEPAARPAAAAEDPQGLMRFVNFGLAFQLLMLWFVLTQGGDASRVRFGAVVAVVVYLWVSGALGAFFSAVKAACCCNFCSCCCCFCAGARRGQPSDAQPARPTRGIIPDSAAAVSAFVLSALPSWQPPPPMPEAVEAAM